MNRHRTPLAAYNPALLTLTTIITLLTLQVITFFTLIEHGLFHRAHSLLL